MAAQASPTMRVFLAGLLLLSPQGMAEEPPRLALPPPPVISRMITLPPEASVVPEVYVGTVSPVLIELRRPIDFSRTRILDGEGIFKFAPALGSMLVVGTSQEISPLDRFRLVVTFQDGTQQPITLTTRETMVDQHVVVVSGPQDPEDLRWLLADSQRQVWAAVKEIERLRREMVSVDHEMARLLASGAVKQTPFRMMQTYAFDDGKIRTWAEVFSGKGMAAATFEIFNNDTVSWRLLEVRLSVAGSGEARPFALGMHQREIPPFSRGRIAVVVDESAFFSGNRRVKLMLRLYRDNGVQQAVVRLEPSLARR